MGPGKKGDVGDDELHLHARGAGGDVGEVGGHDGAGNSDVAKGVSSDGEGGKRVHECVVEEGKYPRRGLVRFNEVVRVVLVEDRVGGKDRMGRLDPKVEAFTVDFANMKPQQAQSVAHVMRRNHGEKCDIWASLQKLQRAVREGEARGCVVNGSQSRGDGGSAVVRWVTERIGHGSAKGSRSSSGKGARGAAVEPRLATLREGRGSLNVNAEFVGGLTVGEKVPPRGGGVGGEGKGSACGGAVKGGLRRESRDLLYSPGMLW